ncbi:Aromatic ring-opening dioxygenase, catalytic subunit, LigB family [Methanolobus vulcani]|uniref:Aromatic ring-opening dioxygenase, catalytic subunit, LigB family n=1 Tax=Methanolobus vulcani TaxID=38026 RepID=A0A7Z7FC85_9EURY|nr:4,5-DOPA dioxygenase extradiol [Methanolobus vulcani]SDF55687.1 Aromatic ring-opening dioxygenase, catalytic subunit, LigB family [Methanolobus vulcani]
MSEKLPEKEKMPVLFIGHGSPMNIILDNSYTQSLVKLGKELPRPEAIMVISAHWMTDGTFVTCNENPKTIYDFYGFPQKLYEVSYPSPGAPTEAELACRTVKKVPVKCSNQWGLDHASWAVLKHMYPEADIPVFEMSINYSFNEWHPKMLQHHYDLASELKEFRNKGVLIIGSGNIVHNLSLIDFQNVDAEPYEWAVELDEKVKENILSGNHRDLIQYLNMGEVAKIGVPTLDHYLPMIYAIALQEEGEVLEFTHEGFQHSSVSMRCFKIG